MVVNITKKMTVVFIVFLAIYLGFVHAQSSCTTPTNATGRCISIRKCSELLEVVKKEQKAKEEITFLRESRCGTDSSNQPMVCCPYDPCFTLEGNEGACVNIHSCHVLQKLLTPPVTRQEDDYVRNHGCDDIDNNRVCCINCQGLFGPPHSSSECCGIGRSNARPDPDTIVTKIDQYPWIAIIESINEKTNTTKFLCGGSLISSKYVLTAAHCVSRQSEQSVRVILGDYDYPSEGPDCVQREDGGKECTDGAISVPIEKIIMHQHYSQKLSYRNDIALLRLLKTIQYTDFIRPICLPTSEMSQDDTIFYIAGWGVAENSKSSNVMLHVDLPYIKDEECQNSYKELQLQKGQICAGGVVGRGACSGDSGGPLMAYNGNYFDIVGIVSFSKHGCGEESNYVVNTKVYGYLPWIRKHIKP